MTSQKEMAEHPDNPYRIGPAFVTEHGRHARSVFNPDGTKYGTYDYEGAEWWAAHLYWEYLHREPLP
jgi:hypothetical protein